jgi:hypothetical protein
LLCGYTSAVEYLNALGLRREFWNARGPSRFPDSSLELRSLADRRHQQTRAQRSPFLHSKIGCNATAAQLQTQIYNALKPTKGEHGLVESRSRSLTRSHHIFSRFFISASSPVCQFMPSRSQDPCSMAATSKITVSMPVTKAATTRPASSNPVRSCKYLPCPR